MYGNITIPEGLSLPTGEIVDREVQEKLAHALEGLTVNMNISGNAATADKFKTTRKIGNANFDGTANITLEQIGAAASSHTHGNMKAATASAAGGAGLVPAPAAGAQTKFLRGDGTWQAPPDTNTTYSPATQSANGLMSAADKTKLDKIAAEANKYTHPTSSGNKHIPSGGQSGQFLKWSADGTAVWAADNNTTYSAATQSANGLMSAADKTKLDKIAAEANKYSHPTTAGNKHIPAGGSSGKILKWSADGTAVWGDEAKAVIGTFSVSGPSGWTANQPAAGLYQYTLASGKISGLTAKHRIDLQASYETLLELAAPIQAVNDNGTCKLVSSEPLTGSVTLQYTLIPTA